MSAKQTDLNCSWLIFRVGVVLRTVVGGDPGESMFVVG